MVLPQPTLLVYDTPKRGENFQVNVSDRAVGYRRTKRDQGGDWDGSFVLYGDIGDLGQKFDSWTGFRFKEKVGSALFWKGIIWEMVLVHKGVARKRSLSEMGNYVESTYINTDDPPQVVTTDPAQNTESVARFGRKEHLLLQDGVPQTVAEAKRDTHLTAHAWPIAIPTNVNLRRQLGETYLEVYLAGDIWTAQYRYESIEGLDENQGNLSYTTEGGAPTFTDDGQDFTTWQTTSGSAHYSIWVSNDDGTTSWGYLGAKVSNTEIRVYTDQALTVTGWNGDGDTTKTPSTYAVYGPVSEWIEDIVETDCEFLTVGAIAENLLQTHPVTALPRRAWDVLKSNTELGDSNGDPYRIYVDLDGHLNYEQIDVTPRYYLQDGKLYTVAGGAVEVNPWSLQPGVIRDVSYPMRQKEYTPWLADARDIYVREWEVGVNIGAIPKTDAYDPENILIAQMNYNQILMDRRKEETEANQQASGSNWRDKLGYSQEEWLSLSAPERYRIKQEWRSDKAGS